MHPVGFWVRLLAYTVDLAIGGALTLVIASSCWVGVEAGLIANEYPDARSLKWQALWYLGCFVVAHILFWVGVPLRTGGRSIGKRLVGIRIVSADGTPATPKQLLLRCTFGHAIAGLPILLGFLSAGIHARKQGWHDLLAETMVVWD